MAAVAAGLEQQQQHQQQPRMPLGMNLTTLMNFAPADFLPGPVGPGSAGSAAAGYQFSAWLSVIAEIVQVASFVSPVPFSQQHLKPQLEQLGWKAAVVDQKTLVAGAVDLLTCQQVKAPTTPQRGLES